MFKFWSIHVGNLIAVSFLWYGRTTEKLVERQNREQQNRIRGRLLVGTIFTFQHLKALETNGDEFKDFKDLIVTPLIDEVQNNEYEWTYLRRKPAEDTADTTDPFERELWRRFTKAGPPEAEDGAASASVIATAASAAAFAFACT